MSETSKDQSTETLRGPTAAEQRVFGGMFSLSGQKTPVEELRAYYTETNALIITGSTVWQTQEHEEGRVLTSILYSGGKRVATLSIDRHTGEIGTNPRIPKLEELPSEHNTPSDLFEQVVTTLEKHATTPLDEQDHTSND